MLADFVKREALIVVPDELFSVAADDHQDAAPSGPMVWFDDEVGSRRQNSRQMAQHGMGRHQRVPVRRGHADLPAQVVHLFLPVHQREAVPGIQIEDAFRVAAIHPQHAPRPQLTAATQQAHAVPPKADP